MIGFLEKMLVREFDSPKVSVSESGATHPWSVGDDSRQCVLYKTILTGLGIDYTVY